MFTSNEAFRILGEWRRQRFSLALFVPVAVTLVAASLVGTPWPSTTALGARLGAAFVTVLALRLWDDLEDRHVDALHHPERVLTTVQAPRFFVGVVAGLLLVGGGLCWLGHGWALVLVALVAILALLYRHRQAKHERGAYVVLLKYPVLAFALGRGTSLASLLAFAATLSAVCVDELVHDGRPRRIKLLVATVSWVIAATWMITVSYGNPFRFVGLKVVLGGAAIGLFFLHVYGRVGRKVVRRLLVVLNLSALVLSTSRIAELVHVP